MPRVSVVVASHNSGGTIGEAVTSLLCQIYDDFDAVVVDDASTDDTQALVARLLAEHAPRMRYLRRETNGGAAAARNDGIRATDSEFVCFLDKSPSAGIMTKQCIELNLRTPVLKCLAYNLDILSNEFHI